MMSKLDNEKSNELSIDIDLSDVASRFGTDSAQYNFVSKTVQRYVIGFKHMQKDMSIAKKYGIVLTLLVWSALFFFRATFFYYFGEMVWNVVFVGFSITALAVLILVWWLDSRLFLGPDAGWKRDVRNFVQQYMHKTMSTLPK